MLATVIAAKADPELEPDAKAFADHICKHFVLLFAAGLKPPLPALPSNVSQCALCPSLASTHHS